MLVPRFLTNAYDIGHAVIWITAMMVCNTLYLFSLVYPYFVLTLQKFWIVTEVDNSGLVGDMILGYFLMSQAHVYQIQNIVVPF